MSSPSPDNYDIYGPLCIPRAICHSLDILEPQMVQHLRHLIPCYLKAIKEDTLEEFWQWLMPRWEQTYLQCFMYPSQPEYQQMYQRWQICLEDWLDTDGGSAWEKFLQNQPSTDSTVSVLAALCHDGESKAESGAVKELSATSSDLEYFGRVSAYSDMPGKCILKRNQVELISYMEKWLATIPPPTETMELEKWAKIMMEKMVSSDADITC